MSQSPAYPRVVVTGLGVMHALGQDADTYWSNLTAGKSGIRRLEAFDPSDLPCQIGAEVPDFDPEKAMDRKEVKRNDRYVHYAMAAAKGAIADGQLDVTKVDAERFGVLIGSGIGGLDTIQEQVLRMDRMGTRKVSPFMIPSLIANMASGVVAIEVGAKGPNYAIVSACATSTHTIGEAWHLIRRGEADIVLAGGSEAALVKIGCAGFCSMRAMSTGYNDRPEAASRPFDKGRDGFVMGDGAGVLILETEEHAKARGAKIYGEVIGYAATCDAYHITSPDPAGDGLAKALKRTLAFSGIEPTEVDYINAHGTSTPMNDKFETSAIKQVFGEHAAKLKISSTKSMTGHLLGAAGGVEAIACAKTLETQTIAPTINYTTPDPECDLDYVPNEKQAAEVDVCLSSNLGFGGHNAVLAMRRWK